MKNEESGAGDSQAKHVGAELKVLVTTGVDVYADLAGKTTQVLWSVDPTHVSNFSDIEYRASIYSASHEELSLFDLGIQGRGYVVHLKSIEGDLLEIRDGNSSTWTTLAGPVDISPASTHDEEKVVRFKERDESTRHCVLKLTTERKKSLDEKEGTARPLTHDTVPRDIRTGGN